MMLKSLGLITALAVPVEAHAAVRECAQSPGRIIELCVSVQDGRPVYNVQRNQKLVIASSTLGLAFKDQPDVRYSSIAAAQRDQRDSTWTQPWGEERQIRDRHTELAVTFAPANPRARRMRTVFRIFDDGIGFRYVFPDIPAGQPVEVIREDSQFALVGDHQAWWYNALGQERDEYLYTQTDARRITLAETPLTMRRSDGLHISIHEAALVDFPSMLLAGNAAGTLSARLMPWPDGVLAKKSGPFTTSWRTVSICETAGALADSRMILNLNEPNKLGDVSWFQPGKYVGIWWEMHLEKSTWGSGPKHGANNANVRRYIDFAAKHGFDGVLVEGWNKGWDGDWIANGDKFNFTESYPDFDLPALSSYARSKGVSLIGHHETGGGVENYERQLEDAMALYRRVGVPIVKTGYVRHSGEIVDASGGKQWFAGQYMVRHHQKVAEVAAKNRVAVNAHEPVKDTGLRRTYPNMVSREGARGQEFNAWGRPTNPPEHMTILPFTRLLAGPMDFTPGIFDLTFGKSKLEERVQSTLATQLAEYVVVYSPVHMAADLPQNYEANPRAFQFIKDVPTDWEVSRTLQGEVGDFVVVARRERGGGDWYLGAITDENGRAVEQPLSFLDPRRRYEAQIYRDGPAADYRTNPKDLTIERRIVTSGDKLSLQLAPGGGAAVRFKALK